MLKVFCKEQLEKQTVVHGMEMAHEDFSCSVGAGGLLAARWELNQGLAGVSPGVCWELTRSSPAREGLASSSGSSHHGGRSGMGRPGSSPGQGGCVVSSALGELSVNAMAV